MNLFKCDRCGFTHTDRYVFKLFNIEDMLYMELCPRCVEEIINLTRQKPLLNCVPMFKWNREYITLPELVKKQGDIRLTYCRNNNSIQVRDKNDKFMGCLKYDWESDHAAPTVSE